MWQGIVNNFICPHCCVDYLNGNYYLKFLHNELLELLENVCGNIKYSVWYQHDGAPCGILSAKLF